MKIAFFEIRPDEQKILKGHLAAHDCQYYSEKLSAELVSKIPDIDCLVVFVGSEVRKETIDALPQLKYIATRSTGFDHIDVAYAKQKGITVSTVPAYGTHTVAEFTFALILALSRKIYDGVHTVRTEKQFSLDALKGFDLYGKTLGVVGTGKIGKNVVIIAKGFGMNIVATDAYPDQAFATQYGIRYVSLPELLKMSDIVTLHVPNMPETHHMLNAETILRMKKGALLINTARGEIIETKALLSALKSGHLAGAGLDVLEMERKLGAVEASSDMVVVHEDKELMDMPNVLITPHIAFFTGEAELSIVMSTIENIAGFTQGSPKNVVVLKH